MKYILTWYPYFFSKREYIVSDETNSTTIWDMFAATLPLKTLKDIDMIVYYFEDALFRFSITYPSKYLHEREKTSWIDMSTYK